MKKLLLFLSIVFTICSFGQSPVTVTGTTPHTMTIIFTSLKDSIAKYAPVASQGATKAYVDSLLNAQVEKIFVKTKTGSGTIVLDTLTAPANSKTTYLLSVTAGTTAEGTKVLTVTNIGGVYTIRQTNPMGFQGINGGIFQGLVINGLPVVQIIDPSGISKEWILTRTKIGGK